MKQVYTVRFAHLEKPSELAFGRFVNPGDCLGIMGNTGKSTGAHLHIDATWGSNAKKFRMLDIADRTIEPAFKQLAHFIDWELGRGPFKVTTFPYDFRYKIGGAAWKAHPGYDLVVQTHTKRLYWNRSMTGRVIKNGYDSGYGHHLYVAFKA